MSRVAKESHIQTHDIRHLWEVEVGGGRWEVGWSEGRGRWEVGWVEGRVWQGRAQVLHGS